VDEQGDHGEPPGGDGEGDNVLHGGGSTLDYTGIGAFDHALPGRN
jgi:hypothetical protein